MNTLERNVEKVKEVIPETDNELKSLERMKYRLSDAIREGSKVSGQAYNWTDAEDNMCALSAAVAAATARGYMA